MSLSNIMNKTHAEVTPYNLIVNSINTRDLEYSNGIIATGITGTGINIPINAPTTVLFNNIDDADSFTTYNAGTGVYTVQKDGYYLLVFNASFASNITPGFRAAWVEYTESGPGVRNLSYTSTLTLAGSSNDGVIVTSSRFLFSGTTFKFVVLQNSANPLQLNGGSQAFPTTCVVSRQSYESSD